MKSVETALLFAGHTGFEAARLGAALNAQLADTDIQLEEICPHSGADVMFRGPGLTLAITEHATPLAAGSFAGALESPLSKPVAGMLTETLARHDRHILVQVTANGPHSRALSMLQTAHAATSVLAGRYRAAAVHWRQSNQLLTGAQYRGLAGDISPWALFAQAQIAGPPAARATDSAENPAQDPPQTHPQTQTLTLPQAGQFIGRPIRFITSDQPLDQVHAAALSFLRHAVETGSPIPDGHSFGPKGGPRYLVSHIAPSAQFPDGIYDLSVVSRDADKTPDGPARPSGVTNLIRDMIGAPQTPSVPASALSPVPPRRERTRAMAIGYLMLVLMPPVGAILLLSNALFGSNAWRTGLAATAVVALAMVVGAYTFLNIAGPRTTLVSDGGEIASAPLAE